MFKNLDDLQKLGKDNADLLNKAFASQQKSAQAVAAEVQDYAKKSMEAGSAFVEKLFGAKSLDKAIEVQTEYAKSAYEGFVASATKIGEIYADAAKEVAKPFETAFAKVQGK
ncbi:MAG TPA: phasin family protein [Beijerinckiaceae bacterium]|nr:phasin family protein [Beijerinckiaceae bacterium]